MNANDIIELIRAGYTVVEFGSNGDAVKAVQALLNCNGQKLKTDGIFGKLTQDALIAVTGDSVCGFSAWEKTYKELT